MVRKYAHLSTTHLAEYKDRVTSLKVVASGGAATIQPSAQKWKRPALLQAFDHSGTPGRCR